MLKKAKTRKAGTRIMAWVMACTMLLSLVGIMPVEAKASDEAQVTSWEFTTDGGFGTDKKYEGTTGEFNGLAINAQNGKLEGKGTYAQYNAGTIVGIPVSGNSEITVVAFDSNFAKSFTFNGKDIEDSSITVDGATLVYNYEGSAGTVELGASAGTYIISIAVEALASSEGGNVGETHVLDMAELKDYVNVIFSDAETPVPNNSYFTIVGNDTKATINSNKKTFKDADGNTIFEGTYRFNPGGGGSHTKRAIKFTTTGEAKVTVYWVSGGNDRQMYLLDSTGATHAATTESVKDTLYASTLDIAAAGTYYLCGKDGTNYIYGVEVQDVIPKDVVYELDMAELKDYVNVIFSDAETPVPNNSYFSIVGNDTKATINSNKKTFKDADGNTVFEGTYRFNPGGGGSHTKRAVKFTTSSATAEVTVYWVSGGNDRQMYVLDSTGATHAVTTESVKDALYASTLDITGAGTYYLCGKDGTNYIYKVVVTEKGAEEKKFDTYTLSGSYSTGLDNPVELEGLKFTAVTESDYKVPDVVLDTTKGTYSVVLEQGTTYEVSAIGATDYDLIPPTGSITYTEDATLDLAFSKKPVYPITVVLGSTPSLTGKEVVYTFTHSDGTIYTYAAGEDIELRDGTYAVAISGDINEMPYAIKSGNTMTVAGAAVSHAITFRKLTTWSFAELTETIQKTTGYFRGLSIDATAEIGKLAPHSSSKTAQFNKGTIITVPVDGPCSIIVTAYQAKYALYTINGEAASTTDVTTTYKYTGEAGTIDIVATGSETESSAYIASISLVYPEKEVEYVEQPVMPSVPKDDKDANTAADTDGVPRQNKQDALTIQPVGQKLNLSQNGGSFADAFADTKDVSYYLFPLTDGENTLEFDLLVTESKATSNTAGFFGGVFTDNYVYSIGLRAGGQKIRGVYSKNGGLAGGSFAGAGSPTEEAVGLNRQIHYYIEVVDGRPSVTITFIDDEGKLQKREWSQSPVEEPNGKAPEKFYYGFALANISATITNMVYKDADGKVLYDQNACYYPDGDAPVASTVTAVPSETREYIDITWTGTVPEYDGTYVVEMQKDGGEWIVLTTDVTGFNYRHMLPAGESGNYKFRVCGQLGKDGLGGERSEYATMEKAIYAKAALQKPELEGDVVDKSITIAWQAVEGAEYYVVYRYSSDEGADAAVVVAERHTTTTYVDTKVTIDVPYYYYVKAVNETNENESPLSETIWQVVASERVGDYVYEDEATEIFITKKSYDTVFTNKVVLEGIVYGEGTLTAVVNGEKVKTESVKARGKFAFELTVEAGRNDVNLFFTDKDGNITRETFNFVYLTNYDKVVDAKHNGENGALVNGVPTYKTVQAAVDSVAADNKEQVIILVLAGSYEERLVVNTPNITLIGEDRENTLIHCYPADLIKEGLLEPDVDKEGNKIPSTNYEAGGDMDKRCATYIKDKATGFAAENISFANDYVYGTSDGKSNKSADAIRVEANKSTFVNVGFQGVQDTLYMHSGNQYYYKCVIEGLVDFIYSGDEARSFFNDCEIVFVYEATKKSGYVCAPKTAASATYGLTFYNCVITAEEGCAGTGYLLARPWGPDAYITWIDCYMGKVINEYEPYGDMSGNMHEGARFYEFGSYGPSYQINVDRRQISPTMAEAMVSADYLGWDPAKVVADMASKEYVGTITTDRVNYATAEAKETKYLETDGDDTGLKMYDMEGYADAYGVTGGGLLLETNENYYKVDTAEEFLDALLKTKTTGKNSVIELTADINLGSNEIKNFASYKDIIKAYAAQPLTHPTLIESGVSQLTFNNIYNLTIFSQNGASIKHANITMKNSENIIIRNIKFDELWEWDEATKGDYDRNDWDYMTIDSNCNGIWIDHCTFYKAYDGIIDVKNPTYVSNVTISWCAFLPGSENDEFFDVMMDEIFENPEDYATYQHMKEEGMTDEQVYMYAYGQKKTHLFGQDDTATNAAGIRVTLANNYYKNSMDRMPRLRYGYTHVYNCIMDAQDLLDVRLSIGNEDIAKKIVSNGAASTCGAQVLLENCYISGIQNALNSGNGSSPSGYINAINSVYYMNGVKTELAPKCNTTGDTRVLVTDADAFIAELPYADYVLYDAEELNGIVKYYAGAGVLDLTVLQWEKTSYNAKMTEPDSVIDEIKVTVETTVKEIIDALKEVIEKAVNTKPVFTLDITENGKISAQITLTIKDTELTLRLEQENGIIWEINGKDVTDKAVDADMTVELDSKAIPESKLEDMKEIGETRQFSIKHNGDFGFKANMKYPAGEKANGKYAYLFWYDNGTYKYVGHDKVERGYAEFTLDHASDYVVVLSEDVLSEDTMSKLGDLPTVGIYVMVLLGAAFVTAGFFAKKKFTVEE